MTRPRSLAALLLIVAAIAVPGTSAHADVAAVPDPLAMGPDAVYQSDYDAGLAVVGGGTSTIPIEQELDGDLFIPQGTTGRMPLIALLHGRHSTCTVGVVGSPIPEADALGYPCPTTEVTQPIDSFRGYDYLATNLASHGYLVISMDANSINTSDTASQDSGALARAELIAKTLDAVRTWDTADGPAGVGSRLLGRVDLTRIGVMGHSRGGEGVNAFATWNHVRPATQAEAMSVDDGLDFGPRYPGVKAIFALAPIDKADQDPTGYAMGTLVPYCDGDVSDLSGTRPFEREVAHNSAAGFPSVMFGVQGTDHNYYNTTWTSTDGAGGDAGDDDAGDTDTACGSASPTTLRLSPVQQRNVGTALMGAFLRRYVGPEPAFDPIITGAAHLPADACPTPVANQLDATKPTVPVPCDQEVQTSFVAPAAQRRVLQTPGTGTAVGFTTHDTCTPATDGTGCPMAPTKTDPALTDRSTTLQDHLVWDGPASLTVSLGTTDASTAQVLTLRMAASYLDTTRNPAAVSQDLDVTLTDAAGGRATVEAAPWAAGALVPERHGDKGGNPELVLGDVRIPLTAFAGVDLGRLASLTLGFGTRTPAGDVELAGIALQEPAAAVVTGFHPVPYTPLGSWVRPAGVTDVWLQVVAAKVTGTGAVVVGGQTALALSKGRTASNLVVVDPGAMAVVVHGASARIGLKVVGYDSAGPGDAFHPFHGGRVSARKTVVSRSLTTTLTGKGAVRGPLDAVLLDVRITHPSKAGAVSMTVGGTSARTVVGHYVAGRTTDLLVVARPDRAGKVRTVLSAGSAKVVLDERGSWTSSVTAGQVTSAVAPRAAVLRHGSAGISGLPLDTTSVLVQVVVSKGSGSGEVVVGGGRDGVVAFAPGAGAVQLVSVPTCACEAKGLLGGAEVPVRVSGGHRSVRLELVGLSTGR